MSHREMDQALRAPPRSASMTDQQFERLPALLQTIVDADRELGASMAPKVITIAEARGIQRKLRHRRDLAKQAHATYGNELKGRDGTART